MLKACFHFSQETIELEIEIPSSFIQMFKKCDRCISLEFAGKKKGLSKYTDRADMQRFWMTFEECPWRFGICLREGLVFHCSPNFFTRIFFFLSSERHHPSSSHLKIQHGSPNQWLIDSPSSKHGHTSISLTATKKKQEYKLDSLSGWEAEWADHWLSWQKSISEAWIFLYTCVIQVPAHPKPPRVHVNKVMLIIEIWCDRVWMYKLLQRPSW